MNVAPAETSPTPAPEQSAITAFLEARGYRFYPNTMRKPHKHLFQLQPKRWRDASLNIHQLDPGYFHFRGYTEPVFEVELYCEIEDLGVSFSAKIYTLMFADLCRHIDFIESVVGRIADAMGKEKTNDGSDRSVF